MSPLPPSLWGYEDPRPPGCEIRDTRYEIRDARREIPRPPGAPLWDGECAENRGRTRFDGTVGAHLMRASRDVSAAQEDPAMAGDCARKTRAYRRGTGGW